MATTFSPRSPETNCQLFCELSTDYYSYCEQGNFLYKLHVPISMVLDFKWKCIFLHVLYSTLFIEMINKLIVLFCVVECTGHNKH